jgi:hypothetical protein
MFPSCNNNDFMWHLLTSDRIPSAQPRVNAIIMKAQSLVANVYQVLNKGK